MNIIDAAYKRQLEISRSRVALELLQLEDEIIESRKNMREAWNRLCEAEGLRPSDMQAMERLEVSEGNEELGQTCLIYTRLFVGKVGKYKKLCKLHGLKPDPKIFNTKEVHNNERSSSNSSKSQKSQPDSGRRPIGSGGSRRVSRRGKKRKRS